MPDRIATVICMSGASTIVLIQSYAEFVVTYLLFHFAQHLHFSVREDFVVLDAKSFQDFLFIARFPKGSLFLFLFLSFFNNLPGDVICNSAVYADDVTFNWKKDSAFDI